MGLVTCKVSVVSLLDLFELLCYLLLILLLPSLLLDVFNQGFTIVQVLHDVGALVREPCVLILEYLAIGAGRALLGRDLFDPLLLLSHFRFIALVLS